MPAKQSEIRIGLIGPSSAGKTSLFQTIHESLDRGRHGFARAIDPQIRHEVEPPSIEDLSPEDLLEQLVAVPGDKAFERDVSTVLSGSVSATTTEQIITRHFSLSYKDPLRREARRAALTITDAAGEHSFPGNTISDVGDVRKKLFRVLSNCHGYVVVVPFSNATSADFIRQLEKWLTGLNEIVGRDKKDNNKGPEVGVTETRRWVIALTRYDTLFTDFGSEALNLAADPTVATDIVNRLVRDTTNGTGYRNNIARFDSANGGRFQIAFMPTSAFGFVPGFGCVNLDSDVPEDQALSDIEAGQSPGPFRCPIPTYPGQSLFPFLTADPFIYAATDLENDFAVPLEAALNQTSFKDRKAKAGARPSVPPETSQPSPSVAHPATAAPTPPPVQKESWRRQAARAFTKLRDIEL